jgi:hypothetical protein
VLQAAFVQARQQFALADAVAFLNSHFGDAFTAVEGELHLADIDVAVQRQAAGT